ncbi:MAG: 2OG-Fe(II) oxygenase [Magnetococcus sp. WYHC-3]
MPSANTHHPAIAQALAEQGWVEVPGYLDPAATAALREEFPSPEIQPSLWQPAAIGRRDQRQQNTEVRRGWQAWLEPGAGPAQRDHLQRLDALRTDMNRLLYLGLRSVEAFASWQQPGDFYRTHRDNFQDGQSRVVTAVLYLNPHWQPHLGGELRLMDDQGAEVARILPQDGTLACFLSRHHPHEVLPAQRPRLAIPAWLRHDDPATRWCS